MNKQINLQSFTKLPLQQVQRTTELCIDLLITTPHKGKVILNLTQKHYPFLFGSVTETNKGLESLLNEIFKIESDANSFLMDKWLESIK